MLEPKASRCYKIRGLTLPSNIKDITYNTLFTITPALQLFRETSNPVFFVQHADNSFLTEGSPGFKLSDAILPRESEDLIVKRYPNSFYKTTLAEKLKKEKVGFVVICGLAASKCVTATIQGALENDFSAAILIKWRILGPDQRSVECPLLVAGLRINLNKVDNSSSDKYDSGPVALDDFKLLIPSVLDFFSQR